MIDIQIEKVIFSIPGSWDEVTVKQYSEMVKYAGDIDPVRMLSILTELDYDSLNNMDCSGFFEKVLPALIWTREPMDIATLPRKKEITIDGKPVKVIEYPGKESIGQKLKMTNDLTAAET